MSVLCQQCARKLFEGNEESNIISYHKFSWIIKIIATEIREKHFLWSWVKEISQEGLPGERNDRACDSQGEVVEKEVGWNF